MCGRYGVRVNFKTLAKLLRAEPVTDEEWGPDFNVAPTDLAPVILPPAASEAGATGTADASAAGAPLRLDLFRWGLVPFWAKSPREGAKMINARGETLKSKPAFREALAERRLLVPASGWFEWTEAAPDAADKKPDPHWIHPPEVAAEPEQLVLFGGLWAKWKDQATGQTLRSFSIVTTEAADSTRVLHERMPLVLGPEAQRAWLDPTTPPDVIQGLLVPYPGPLRHRRVAKAVNNVRADGPELIEPLAEVRQSKLL